MAVTYPDMVMCRSGELTVLYGRRQQVSHTGVMSDMWQFDDTVPFENTNPINQNKMLSYRRETALQGALVYRSIFNHCDIIGLQSHQIWWKNAK